MRMDMSVLMISNTGRSRSCCRDGRRSPRTNQNKGEWEAKEECGLYANAQCKPVGRCCWTNAPSYMMIICYVWYISMCISMWMCVDEKICGAASLLPLQSLFPRLPSLLLLYNAIHQQNGAYSSVTVYAYVRRTTIHTSTRQAKIHNALTHSQSQYFLFFFCVCVSYEYHRITDTRKICGEWSS